MNTNTKTYLSHAPGRICLFGDHQDYLELPVIACAIDRYITIAAEPNSSKNFIVTKQNLNEVVTISINDTLEFIENSDYLRLALRVLRRHDCIPNQGFNVTISGTIPINAGLSSSSALMVAWIQFLVTTFGVSQTITPELIARLAYEAEVLELRLSGGKMDMYTITYGNTIFLDTKNDSVTPITQKVGSLIIGVSGDSKDTLGNLRSLKKRALKAINEVKEKQPSFDITETNLSELKSLLALVSEDLKPIFEAAVKNYFITKSAQKEFDKKAPNLNEIGKLMNQHHQLLRDNLKITTARIDNMITSALNQGAYGAKIVGSGGGGCIVVIAPKGKEEHIISAIKQAGAVDAFLASVSIGAKIETR